MQGLADGYQGNDPSKSFQAIFPPAVEYYGQADFLDAFLTSAIDGSENFSEVSDQVRAAAISSGLLAIMNYWVRFELEIARNKAAAANFACPKGAPHNWDESFAIYDEPDMVLCRRTSLYDHYESQFRLLLDTIADELVPGHWRCVCLDSIYKPLCCLKSLPIINLPNKG